MEVSLSYNTGIKQPTDPAGKIMNTPLYSNIPAAHTPTDRDLVEQENSFLLDKGMQPYSMNSAQDIAEAARDIRNRNAQFINANVLDNRGLFSDIFTGHLRGREFDSPQPHDNRK